jgi:hypothetical protein
MVFIFARRSPPPLDEQSPPPLDEQSPSSSRCDLLSAHERDKEAQEERGGRGGRKAAPEFSSGWRRLRSASLDRISLCRIAKRADPIPSHAIRSPLWEASFV